MSIGCHPHRAGEVQTAGYGFATRRDRPGRPAREHRGKAPGIPGSCHSIACWGREGIGSTRQHSLREDLLAVLGRLKRIHRRARFQGFDTEEWCFVPYISSSYLPITYLCLQACM